MRISDWSSDVCSSDLLPDLRARLGGARVTWIYPYGRSVAWEIYAVARLNGDRAFGFWNVGSSDKVHPADYRAVIKMLGRSEERRVGQECVRQCRSRRSPYP